MVFSSVAFLFAFLPATLLGYYVLPRRWRIAFLLLVSLVFYAWGEPVYVLLMMGSILVNWCIGLLMARWERRKKALLILAVVIDLAMLAVFKYAGSCMGLMQPWCCRPAQPLTPRQASAVRRMLAELDEPIPD